MSLCASREADQTRSSSALSLPRSLSWGCGGDRDGKQQQVGVPQRPGRRLRERPPGGAASSDGGGIFVNKATAKSNAPTLDLCEDFQCPTCGALEKAMGPTMTSLSNAGDGKFVIHTLTFLDDNLKNESSKRAANAAASASDAGGFLPHHALLFAAQPAQEGAGYTDAQLTQLAAEAGITGPALATWQKCTSAGLIAQVKAATK